MGVGKGCAAGDQAVHVGCQDIRIAQAGEGVVALIVGKVEEHIGARHSHYLQGAQRGAQIGRQPCGFCGEGLVDLVGAAGTDQD